MCLLVVSRRISLILEKRISMGITKDRRDWERQLAVCIFLGLISRTIQYCTLRDSILAVLERESSRSRDMPAHINFHLNIV